MKNRVAIIYDFDLTLSNKEMQEFGLFDAIKTDNDTIMQRVRTFAKDNNADLMLSFLLIILKQAKENKIKITRNFLKNLGKNISYFNEVETWFDRINKFGKDLGLKIEHYIISAGHKEMLEGTSIFKHFKRVFGCEYLYDENGEAYWPKILINYTTKTQFLFRIRKNRLDDLYDDYHINNKLEDDKQLSFKNVIYLGDGATDIPCMQIITNGGGLSLSLYDEQNKKKMLFANDLLEDKRVSASIKADYSEDSEIDKIIKERLKEIAKNYKTK